LARHSGAIVMSRTVAIVQARMGSSRLPGKIVVDLAGKPMLVRQIDRMREATRIDEIVIATTDRAIDDPIVALGAKEGVPVFRGSENAVLSRSVGAARAHRAHIVVRITADCPLLFGAVIDRVIEQLVTDAADYASNTIERTYPRGLDTEALTAETLFRID